MIDHLIIALLLLAIAGVLIFLGVPKKSGQHPRFLQFDSALVLYPPVVLVCLAMGATEVITALLGISH